MSSTQRPEAGLARIARSLSGLVAGLMALALALTAPASHGAGIVDISNVPLGTSLVTAKPNVMFILDDSGSMGWDFLPDNLDQNMIAGGQSPNGFCDATRYGCLASQCNGVAFDPNESYLPPINFDGTSYPPASFSAAWNDGYNTSAGTTDLGKANRNGVTPNVYYAYTPQAPRVAQPAMNWRYNADGSLISNTFSQECFSSIGSLPGVFSAKTVDVASGLQQKYANWWSYYRKRYLLMRSAVGRSFSTLDTNYRVGFSAISDPAISGDKFLDVKDFDQTQRNAFYTKLYGGSVGGGTPLRGALSKIGSYYGKAISGQSYDPAEYTTASGTSKYQCQRNYAILSTDGYWNRNNFSGTLPDTYLNGFKLDGTTPVGEQDGAEARPMRDSTSTVVKTATTTGTIDRVSTDTNKATDTTFTRTIYVVANSIPSNAKACSAGNFYFTSKTQSATSHSTFVTTLIEDVTSSTTTTVTNTDGVVTTSTVVNTPTRSTVSTSDSSLVGGKVTWPTDPTIPAGTSCAAPPKGTIRKTITAAGIYYFDSASQPITSAGVSGTPVTTASPPNAPRTINSTPFANTPVVTTSTNNGDSNSLADIAEYYYVTDLRPDIPDNVKASGRDTATWQHMTTYTIGLGLSGSLNYDPNYLIGVPSGDYGALVNGSKSWPVPTGTISATDQYDATHVDDLWHAAVNGRGQYFSASTAGALSSAITSSLKDVTAARGSAAAAASSTLTPSATDDWLFLTRYNSAPTWNGDLLAFKFTFNTDGTLNQPDTSAGKELWSVQGALDARDLAAAPARVIKFNSGGALADFNYANLSATQKAYFDNHCTTASIKLAQCGSLTANALAQATGSNMVAFLAGNNSLLLNNANPDNRVWRARSHRLGDIVHASPVYVGKPSFDYNDAGYTTFAAAKANRPQVVYVGANDGMLHAFLVNRNGSNTTTANPGDELWAYVPGMVIPDLWHLADSGYDTSHRYYVDATVNVGDVFDGTNWRTILVGGLGAGGRGYFALDITDPVNPSLLWEYTNNNLGLTYGNPVIAKNKTGTWTVAFASGYNNVNPGDGVGRLFVLNAVTGALIGTTVDTTAGDSTTPSNLARINAWVLKDTDNTALRYYGGDMLGNLWRFDPDDIVAPSGVEALLLGQARGPNNEVQPITARPLLTEIAVGAGQAALISFGTGRYLGTGDLTNTDVQSIYTVKDNLLATGLGVLRGSTANLVKLTLGTDRKLTSQPLVDWTVNNGWYVDLAISQRERVYLDPTPVGSGVIAFASIIPNGDVCSSGGSSWLYEFGIKAGTLIQATFYASPIVGDGRVVDSDGPRTLITTQEGLGKSSDRIPVTSLPDSPVKRTSWRELQE